jgi:hypothetical protein
LPRTEPSVAFTWLIRREDVDAAFESNQPQKRSVDGSLSPLSWRPWRLGG